MTENFYKEDLLSRHIKDGFPSEYLEFSDMSRAVIEHPLFNSLNSVENIKIYSEFQIWCVWDFMSILKVAQNMVFNNSILWTPPEDAGIGFQFYELLLTEETDKSHPCSSTERMSHFDTFIFAMNRMGADTSLINEFIVNIKKGMPLQAIFESMTINNAILNFISTNNELIIQNPVNAISLLSLTRENFLPLVFKSVVNNAVRDEDLIEPFIWYHKRHIELDEGVHGPIADNLYKKFVRRKNEIRNSLIVSTLSLKARYDLLDEIVNHLK